MKVILFGLIGLVFGAIAGGAVGVGSGLVWTEVFHTSSFEGYSGMLVFFGFMPGGVILGALAGAIGLGYAATRERTAAGDPS